MKYSYIKRKPKIHTISNPSDYIKKEELNEILPFFGGFVILSGVLKLFIFYYRFNINILDYIEPSELLFAFIKDFIPFTALVFLTVFTIIFSDKGKQHTKREFLKNQFINTEQILKRIFIFIKIPPLYYLSLGSLLITSFLYFVFKKDFFLSIIYALLIYNVVLYASLEFKRLYKKYFKFYPSATKINIILLIIAYYFVVYLNKDYSVDMILNNKKYIGTTLKYENEKIIKSERNTYFIGKTNKFVFFYNDSSKTSIAYDVNKIKQFYIIEKDFKELLFNKPSSQSFILQY